MNILRTSLFTLLASISVCFGELLVYEPFDYKPQNDETMGRLEGRNGGLGRDLHWRRRIT